MIDHLLSRASAAAFDDPGPDLAALDLILQAALRAPDHGKLRPWHFFAIAGSARVALSDLFVESLKRREPDATPARIEKERSKPLRSPVTIAVVARIADSPKIPVVEQLLSAGAAAMNILNAAHALGFAAKWVTGENCYDPHFRQAFGLRPADQLAAFIHIGSASAAQEKPRPAVGDFMTVWNPTP